MINNPIIHKFFKDFTNNGKKTNRAVVFRSKPFPNILFLEGGLLVILIDCMSFLSPFLDVTTRMSMSTVSFLAP